MRTRTQYLRKSQPRQPAGDRLVLCRHRGNISQVKQPQHRSVFGWVTDRLQKILIWLVTENRYKLERHRCNHSRLRWQQLPFIMAAIGRKRDRDLDHVEIFKGNKSLSILNILTNIINAKVVCLFHFHVSTTEPTLMKFCIHKSY